MLLKSQYDLCGGDTLHCRVVDRYDDSPVTSYKLKFSDECKWRLAEAKQFYDRWNSKDEEVDEDYYDVHDNLIDFLNEKLLPALPSEVQWDFEGTVENGQLAEVYEWIGSVLQELAAEKKL